MSEKEKNGHLFRHNINDRSRDVYELVRIRIVLETDIQEDNVDVGKDKFATLKYFVFLI